MRFMQTESVLQTKKRSGPAKNRFSVALILIYDHELDHGSYCNSNILMYDHELDHGSYLNSNILMYDHEQQQHSDV